jgi:hypothetical protein
MQKALKSFTVWDEFEWKEGRRRQRVVVIDAHVRGPRIGERHDQADIDCPHPLRRRSTLASLR